MQTHSIARNDQNLLTFHIRECHERYQSIEKRLNRIEAAIWTMLVTTIGFGADMLFHIR